MNTTPVPVADIPPRRRAAGYGGGAVTRTSEFGNGYATCLRQFTFHRARLEETVALYADMATRYPSFEDRDGAETWANGASDHLYELHRPRRGVPAVEWKAARALADRALHIGHGFQPTSKSTPDECRGLLDAAAELLTQLAARGYPTASLDDCIATDRQLGLSPLAGSWSCDEDISHTNPTVASQAASG